MDDGMERAWRVAVLVVERRTSDQDIIASTCRENELQLFEDEACIRGIFKQSWRVVAILDSVCWAGGKRR